MPLVELKLFYILAIFAAGLLGGRIPLRSSQKGQIRTGLEKGEAFSGGVFLGAGLLHLLPDANDNFAQFAGGLDFPLASLVAGIGLLAVLLFDRAAHGTKTQPSSSPFLLFLVLSIHSVIAGAALGLEATGVASIAIFIAIIAHKSSAGFALGVALAGAKARAAGNMRTIVLFSTMTPLGVVLGSALGSMFSGEASIIFEAIFDALAAGTFLYISAFDILPKALRRNDALFTQWIMAAVGFSTMAMIAFWA